MNNKNGKGPAGMAIGMCVGIAVGCALGAATHNMGVWIPVGLSVGMCLGLAFSQGKREDTGEDGRDENPGDPGENDGDKKE